MDEAQAYGGKFSADFRAVCQSETPAEPGFSRILVRQTFDKTWEL